MNYIFLYIKGLEFTWIKNLEEIICNFYWKLWLSEVNIIYGQKLFSFIHNYFWEQKSLYFNLINIYTFLDKK